MAALALFGLVGCAKGDLGSGGGSYVTFGAGMASSPSQAGDGDDGDGDGDGDDAETEGDDGDGDDSPDDGDPSAGATSNGETCGVGCGGSCGNGVLDADEECDGTDLGGSDCSTLGFAGGTLACDACTLDPSGCLDAVCGDGVLGGTEACDCAGSACTPSGLNNQACTDLPAPSGGNYSGGTLGCDGACALDSSGCWACGDGSVDPGEQCDGGSLGGATCQSLGFDQGTLSCSAGCALDTGGCSDFVCGNGVCDPGEDSCTCADCPDDPNSCSTCECGGFGGACYCDLACIDYGDCCFDGPC